MMLNVIRCNNTEWNWKLMLETCAWILYKDAFYDEFGIETDKKSHLHKIHWHETKGEPLNVCMFEGTVYFCHNGIIFIIR